VLTLTLGDICINRIVELETPFMPPLQAFPDATQANVDEHRHWLEPAALCPLTGKLIIAIQSYLIRTRHHVILVDTCLGCNKTNRYFPDWHQRQDPLWLHKLMQLGVQPAQVDYVFCTHLHGDHCGWNTQLVDGRWVPTFPNAKYIIAAAELQHAAAANSPAWHESVLPLLEAGQVQEVAGDFALDDQVWLQPAPGHTPGHVTMHLRAGQQRAVLCGDLIHSPLQCLYPRWRYWIDSDPEQAIGTRVEFLQAHADTDTLVLTAHFPSPSIGHVLTDGDKFRFRLHERPKN
jgi:glyoxylase-like metal-dependent hydrolase (beta-lactamase superfamily II)